MRGPDALGTERRGGASCRDGCPVQGRGQPSSRESRRLPPRKPAPATGRRERAGHGRRDGGRPADRPARLSLSNWPVSARLVAVFAVASVTGLVFGGLRVADAVERRGRYGRTAQLATLGEQSIKLAQALEDERDLTAGVAAYSTLASSAAKADPAVARPVNAALANENAEMEHRRATSPTRSRAARQGAGQRHRAGLPRQRPVQGPDRRLVGRQHHRAAQRADRAADDPGRRELQRPDLQPVRARRRDHQRQRRRGARRRRSARSTRCPVRRTRRRSSGPSSTAPWSRSASTTRAPRRPRPTRSPCRSTTSTPALALSSSGGLGGLTTARRPPGGRPHRLQRRRDGGPDQHVPGHRGRPAGQRGAALEGFVTLTGNPLQTFEEIGKDTPHSASTVPPSRTPGTPTASAMIGQMRPGRVAGRRTRSSHAASRCSSRRCNSAVLSAVVTGGRGAARAARDRACRPHPGQPAAQAAGGRARDRHGPAARAGGGRRRGHGAGEAMAAVEPIGVQSTDEIGRVARAFDQVHAEAVRLAGQRGAAAQQPQRDVHQPVPAQRAADRPAGPDDRRDGAERGRPGPARQPVRHGPPGHPDARNSENLLVLAGEEPVRKWTESGAADRRGARRGRGDRAVRPGGAHRAAGHHGLRPGGGRRGAPARRADRERHAVLAARDPGPRHRHGAAAAAVC